MPDVDSGDRRNAAANADTRLAAGWERISAAGPGTFVTGELLRRPDGTVMRWDSRSRRKGGAALGPSRDMGVWWRPYQRGWWMAVLFAVGSTCFAAGGIASQWATSSRPVIGVTFFVGSLFFTAAAYLQYAGAVNVERTVVGRAKGRARWRPASWEPRRIDWLAALVQFIGTLLFNISTFAAMNTDLSTHQFNARVWSPDVFGCAAFLISSELAYAEVCHRWICLRRGGGSWKIVAINLLGSIAFAVSAVASLVEPASGEPVSARIANAGTAFGGVCFLIGALLLLPEAARAEAKVRERHSLQTTPAPASPR